MVFGRKKATSAQQNSTSAQRIPTKEKKRRKRKKENSNANKKMCVCVCVICFFDELFR